MSTNLKATFGLIAAFLVVLGIVAASTGGSGRADASAPAAALVREDSHRIADAGEGAPVLVEFLDFECEACRAAYPIVEEVREEYAGQVTVVARYFPISSHANAMNAALAVEAAAQQGQYEAMYQRMYETQAEWGEQQESKADLFRTFAADLGLDLTAYDTAVADPATETRVQRDVDDGTALGVQGTPTFFLDGEIITLDSADDLRRLLDDALAA